MGGFDAVVDLAGHREGPRPVDSSVAEPLADIDFRRDRRIRIGGQRRTLRAAGVAPFRIERAGDDEFMLGVLVEDIFELGLDIRPALGGRVLLPGVALEPTENPRSAVIVLAYSQPSV